MRFGTRAEQYTQQRCTIKLKLTLTLTDTGGAVLTLMLGYRSLYIAWQQPIAASRTQ